jgi:hypothetical protein
MKRETIVRVRRILLSLILCVSATGCNKPPSSAKASSSEAAKDSLPDSPDRDGGLVSARLKRPSLAIEEISVRVKSLIEQESAGLLSLAGAVSPNYLVGDYNGDQLLDIAAVVALKRKVAQDERSGSRFSISKPCVSKSDQPTALAITNLERYEGEKLLVIFHGSQRGLDNFRSGRRFIVLDVIDRATSKLLLFRGKLKPAVAGDEPRPLSPPLLKGDAILLLGNDSSGAAVYWRGNGYCWYPVSGSK